MPELESIHDMPPAPLPEPQPVTHECLECMALLTEAQVIPGGRAAQAHLHRRVGQLRDMRAVRQDYGWRSSAGCAGRGICIRCWHVASGPATNQLRGVMPDRAFCGYTWAAASHDYHLCTRRTDHEGDHKCWCGSAVKPPTNYAEAAQAAFGRER